MDESTGAYTMSPADTDPVRVTAAALVAKLDALGPDPGGFIAFGEVHGLQYSGPTYGAELEALRAALTDSAAQEKRGG